MTDGKVAPPNGETSRRNVFVVHGHDKEARQDVLDHLQKLGLTPFVLEDLPNKGKTVIEKFEHYATKADYAVVLLTPDDVGFAKDTPEDKQSRARQNVIFELGFFVGWLGRDRVCLLTKGAWMPSDLAGLVYVKMGEHGEWRDKLSSELGAAGMGVRTAQARLSASARPIS